MSGYIGNIPTPQATQTRDTFTATAGQTTFATSGYTPSFLDVFLNGVHLVNGTDYTASNGSDVVLTSGAAAGDVLEVVSYSTYQVNSQNYTGGLTVDNDGATVLTVDRATSDGTIIDLQKDGSSVGTIQTAGGELTVATSGPAVQLQNNTAGLNFNGNDFHPFGADDGLISFGTSTRRFKDLYLSGGVYVGGTGAANYLDDYEEGTFTPVFASTATNPTNIAYANQDAEYVKIGNWVTCFVFIKVTSFTDNGGNFAVKNLPFTAASTSGGSPWYSGTVAYSANFSVTPRAVMVDQGYSRAEFWHAGSTSDQSDVNQRVAVSEASSNWQLYFTVTYPTA